MTTSSSPTRRLFKSNTSSCSYIFKDGKSAIFQMGCYVTENPAEIAELDAEIERGHPTFFIDPKEKFVSEERSDPIAALRKRIAAEERAKLIVEMAEATDPSRDLGKSEQGPLTPTSTTDIAAVALGGDSSVRLTNVRKQVAAAVASSATPAA